MNYEKQALLTHLIVVFVLVLGLLGLVIPDRVDHCQKRFLRALRLITVEKASLPLDGTGRTVLRAIGLANAAACAFLLFNCAFQAAWAPAGESRPRRLDEAADRGGSAALDAVVGRHAGAFMAGHGHGCLVVAVIAGEESALYGFGRADMKNGKAPDADTLFEIGSVTKVFTAALLEDFLERRGLSVDAPVLPLLPPLPSGTKVPAEGITLRHLLTHTSGLPAMPGGPSVLSRFFRTITAGNVFRDYTDEIMMETLSKAKDDRDRGTRYAYSNFGFGLLGMVLHRGAGRAYGESLAEVLAGPLGMSGTAAGPAGERPGGMATGYRYAVHAGPLRLAQVASLWEMPESMAGCGGIRSSGRDMRTFLAANMGRAAGGPARLLARTHRPLGEGESRGLFGAGQRRRLAMAWMRGTLPRSGGEILWHDGVTGGFSSFIGFTEDGRFGTVVLHNSAAGVDSLGMEILDSLREGR